MPMENKESSPEVVAVWKIGKCLWNRDFSGVYEAIREFEWSAEIAGMVTAFSGDSLSFDCLFPLCCYISRSIRKFLKRGHCSFYIAEAILQNCLQFSLAMSAEKVVSCMNMHDT